MTHGRPPVMLLSPWIALALVAPAVADDRWALVNVRGSVFALLGGTWQEASDGDTIAIGTAVRTLQAGRVDLTHDGDTFSLGPNTVVRPSPNSGGTGLDQYAGILAIVAKTATRYRVETPAFTVDPSRANITIRIDGKTTILVVETGEVPVLASGYKIVLRTGQVLTGVAGANSIISISTPSVEPQASNQSDGGTDPVGAPSDNAGAGGSSRSGKSDNGKGNGGVPGNGGANGNGHNK